MKVIYVGCMSGDNGFTRLFQSLTTEFKQIPSGKANLNQELRAMANNMKPDLIFLQIQAPNIIDVETLEYIKYHSKFIINYTGDARDNTPQWMIDAASYVDITCFSNMKDVKYMRSLGFKSEYLEIGYDPEIYKPTGSKTPTKDIIFMGNNYVNKFPLSDYRVKMVEFLKKEYPNNFAFYGSGWNFSFGDWNGSQLDEASVYRGGKIAINLSHYDYERYNSDRMLRILGSGIMCLTKRYDGIDVDYSPGINVAVWDNYIELKQNIDFYLSNEKERIEIAIKGSELAKEMFTFESMIKNIIKITNAR